MISQAEASISALQNEPEAIEWLQARVLELTNRARRINKTPDKIISAGAGQRWNVDELFAMSQISLLRFVHSLPTNVSVEFLDISFVQKSPDLPGNGTSRYQPPHPRLHTYQLNRERMWCPWRAVNIWGRRGVQHHGCSPASTSSADGLAESSRRCDSDNNSCADAACGSRLAS